MIKVGNRELHSDYIWYPTSFQNSLNNSSNHMQIYVIRSHPTYDFLAIYGNLLSKEYNIFFYRMVVSSRTLSNLWDFCLEIEEGPLSTWWRPDQLRSTDLSFLSKDPSCKNDAICRFIQSRGKSSDPASPLPWKQLDWNDEFLS